MQANRRIDQSLKSFRTGLSLICLLVFLSIGAGGAENKSLSDKAADLPKAEYMRNIQDSQEKISVFEEKRDHKTFQVASVVIRAKPLVVFDTFSDYRRAPKIFSYCKQCRILSSNGTDKQISFQSALAGGLFKFNYVLEFKEYRPRLIEWHRVSGAFKANEGYWKFQPVEGGKSTLVTYSKYVDAGFPFPQFIVNKELHNDMPLILSELKLAVENAN